MVPGRIGTGDEIVGTIALVGSDKARVVDARKGFHASHLLPDLSLKGWLEHASAIHGFGQIEAADVPSTDHEVVGMNHGQEFMERNIDILASFSIITQLDGRRHDQGAIVVGLLDAFLGLPLETAAIGNDSCSDRGAIVTTPSDKHNAHLSNFTVNLEVIHGLLGRSNELAILTFGDGGGTIGVLAPDLVIGVDHIGRVDREKILTCREGKGSMAVPNGKSLRVVRVGSHCRDSKCPIETLLYSSSIASVPPPEGEEWTPA